jgi:hypothetical protein
MGLSDATLVPPRPPSLHHKLRRIPLPSCLGRLRFDDRGVSPGRGRMRETLGSKLWARTRKGDHIATVSLFSVRSIALRRKDGARSLADHIEHHIRLREHRNMAGGDFGRCSLHPLCREALKLGVNCAVLGANDVPAGLSLPCRAFDFLVEQVRHWHALCRVDEFLLRLGQVAAKEADAAQLQPYATVRHLDVLKHVGPREFVLLALRGLVGIWRESRDIDEPDNAWISAGMRDKCAAI